MNVTVVEGDLLDQDVDVIVNAWNRNIIPWWLLLPQGVSGAIKRRGGTGPFKELAKHGPIPLGGAVLTSAGRLPFKAIIHVAGINMLWRASERSIRDSVRNAMALAPEQGFQSIAFPLIGAGSGGFNQERAQAIMLDELQKLESPLDVTAVPPGVRQMRDLCVCHDNMVEIPYPRSSAQLVSVLGQEPWQVGRQRGCRFLGWVEERGQRVDRVLLGNDTGGIPAGENDPSSLHAKLAGGISETGWRDAATNP